MNIKETDLFWMAKCLELAKTSGQDVPVATLIVKNNELIASAINQKEKYQISTYHAEIIAIEAASRKLKKWRLNDCSLYVNLEPCSMCAGAIVQARIKRLIFATPDPKAGACGSLFNIAQNSALNHQVECQKGVLQKEASKLISSFFKDLRQKTKAQIRHL